MPPDFLSAGPNAAADRQLQSRRFEGIGEADLLAASVGVLQDLGFTVKTSESEAALGVISGAKDREAKAPEQVLAVTILAILAASQGGQVSPAGMRQDQTIKVLLVIQPTKTTDSHLVRVTFHRLVRQPLSWSAGVLREPELYESFFQLLSKSVFLEAHKL